MKNYLNYFVLIDMTMRMFVKYLLTQVAKHGFYDNHYMLITFDTSFDGVQLSKEVKELYPNEIEVVLQYQYYNLKVNKDNFEVDLSFNGVEETVIVPFRAITKIHDPSVDFMIGMHNFKDNDLDMELMSPNDLEDMIASIELFDTKRDITENKHKQRSKCKVIDINEFKKQRSIANKQIKKNKDNESNDVES